MIAAYVSGHGFGHATRTAEVLRVFRELQPAVPIGVASSAPERLFRRAVPKGLTYRNVVCDVGLVQGNALHIDEAATAARVAEFAASYPRLVEREAEWLSDQEASLVVGDVPPLAFDAAAEVGLTAVGIANFSWDWIYRHFAARQPSLLAAADDAARAYGRAALMLELPFAGDLSAFPWRDRIPLVARSPRVPAAEARRRLGLPEGTLVLVSFGGFGVPLDRAAFTLPAGARLVFSEDVADALDGAGLGYQDLVGAVDVVVSKPGYGIVSDVIAARGRLVYTERGDFPEYPILVREMAAYLPAVHVSNAELLAGRIAAAVEQVLALPLPPPADLSGATVAAHRLAELL
jgi:L-arabinokinase